MSVAKASQEYWNGTYTGRLAHKAAFDPHRGGVRNFGKLLWHNYFCRQFAHQPTKTMRLLEIGCGGSRMLPYFAREFGFNITGMDYSEAGCDVARQILSEEGVRGEILHGDLFDDWPRHSGQFDVIVSFGVVEHFVDMSECVVAMSRLLKPGGTMITSVPNMCGLVGLAQQSLCKSVYAKHNLVDVDSLRLAHQRSQLSVVSSEYLGFVNFGVVNINEVLQGSLEWRTKTAMLGALRALTGATWLFEHTVAPMPPNRVTSPYVICRAVK